MMHDDRLLRTIHTTAGERDNLNAEDYVRLGIVIAVTAVLLWAGIMLTLRIMSYLSKMSLSSQDIAKLRYAKGEITKKEFDTLSSDLK